MKSNESYFYSRARKKKRSTKLMHQKRRIQLKLAIVIWY